MGLSQSLNLAGQDGRNLLFTAIPLSVIAFTVYSLCVAIYNITYHPLAHFPGPKLCGAFYFPQLWKLFKGTQATNVEALHKKYGHVVRILPDTLSFSSSGAWQDIYNARKRSGKEFERDPGVFFRPPGVLNNLIIANNEDHQRMRKLLAHSFSDGALREQEPLIHKYCDLLIERLNEQIAGSPDGRVDMVQWLNFTAFDIVGDLAFGEPFQALEKGTYHPWIATIFQNVKVLTTFKVITAYPVTNSIAMALMRSIPAVGNAYKNHMAFSEKKTLDRLERVTDRKDFMTHILRHNDEKGMSRNEIKGTSGILIMAGSETSGTLLSGITFQLLKNPRVLDLLVKEIRSSFSSPRDMTFAAEAKLPYLQACVDEALRIYPPVPIAVTRLAPREGATIDGHFVPPNTIIGVHHLSANHHPLNFKDPLDFVPERWMGDPRYADDDRAACQPFSLGQRNCIGRNLAYAEIKSILVRVLWNFDMQLCVESRDWSNQKVHVFWEKNPLFVTLTRARLEKSR